MLEGVVAVEQGHIYGEVYKARQQ